MSQIDKSGQIEVMKRAEFLYWAVHDLSRHPILMINQDYQHMAGIACMALSELQERLELSARPDNDNG